ncbi:MAG: pro-sigmaK processing inhibitor BofA family protein [Roseburia sp.]|nr:pro-sigmaK processing inhibitor BofA family protein [Roseburia sp.]
MENSMAVRFIVIVCVVVVLLGVMKKKGEWLLNLVMRSVLGIIGIHFMNAALSAVGLSLGIGINPVSVLTIGILGIPGFLALYGLGIYRLL